MNKRKTKRWIIIGIVVVIAAAGIFAAKRYYDDRYVGTPYYTMVPTDYNVTPEDIYSDSNELIDPGVTFELVAYNAAGESKTVTFTVFAPEDPTTAREPMPKPGDYLVISASATIVVGWEFTTQSEIPQAALARISG
jgi:uncharacterized protein YxeA